jgi:hypothetical protein
VALALLGALFIVLSLPGAASAAHLHCGQLVTHSTKLDADLLNCPADGLVLADGVRLNLAGHTIDGTGPGNDSTGIRARRGVTVRNGSIGDHFDQPILLAGPDSGGNTIRDMTIGPGFGGVYVEGDDNVIRDNRSVVGGAEFGFSVFGSRNRIERNVVAGVDIPLDVGGAGNRVLHNTIGGCYLGINLNVAGGLVTHNEITGCSQGVAVNGEGLTMTHNVVTDGGDLGIWFDAADGLLAHNVVTGIRGVGIEVDAPGATVRANTADDNAGIGIWAVPGVIDGGANRAQGNGDPRQCVGVVCR